MPLTHAQIQRMKPQKKLYRKRDNHGLYIEVAISGTKTWLHRYSYDGKYTMRRIGHFPDMGLPEAREKLYEDKKLLRKGVNPNFTKNAYDNLIDTTTLQGVFEQWYKVKVKSWSVEYGKDVRERAMTYLLADLGRKKIESITTRDIINILKKMENKGVLETLSRVKSITKRIFDYAIGLGIVDMNPVMSVSNDLFMPKIKHNYAHITDERKFAQVLLKIDEFKYRPNRNIVNYALWVLPHLFVRSIELCSLEWSEVDLKNKLIRISPHKMKTRDEHLVPMSDIVFNFFTEMQDRTGGGQWVFPSPMRKNEGHISTNALLRALRRIGIEQDEMSLHGFRHTASTMLNEKGYSPEIIEKQLSHTDRNAVRAAYNKSVHLGARRVMMQDWSNYINNLLYG